MKISEIAINGQVMVATRERRALTPSSRLFRRSRPEWKTVTLPDFRGVVESVHKIYNRATEDECFIIVVREQMNMICHDCAPSELQAA